MEEKELKALASEWKKSADELKATNESLTEALKGKADAELIEDLNKKGADLAEKMNKLAEQQDAIQVELKQAGRARLESSFEDQVKAGMKDFKASKSGNGKLIKEFEIKTGTPLSVTTYAGGFDLRTAAILPERIQGIGKAPDRQMMLLDVVPTGATSSNQITWVERTARTEGAVATAEAGVYGESLYTYEQKKAIVEKIPHFTKVTEEMMWDADFLVSEIKNEHIPQLRRKLDYYLLSGNGTSPQILGVTQNAAAYTNTDLNGQVAGANYADAIRAAVNQIVNSNYIPNYVLMNPSDVALMELSKSNTLEYLNVTINGRIHGLPIIQNTGVTAGKVLVGDFSKVTLFYNGGIQISVFDQNESDPIYGLYTIVSKVRAASKIMVCDYTNAFVYDDLADIVNAIKA